MNNTPRHRQAWILEELKKFPLLSFGEMFSKYSVNFSKTEKTFSKDWKQAQQQFTAYQIKAQNEKERVSIEAETEAVKQGLKTKTERIFILQNQIDDILKRLEKGTHTQEIFQNGKMLKYERLLEPREIAMYNKTIKELQSEISKIEGDYAPIKQDVKTDFQPFQVTGLIVK